MAFETEGFSTPVEMFLRGQAKFLRDVDKIEKRLDRIAKKKITPTIGKAFERDASRVMLKAQELQNTLNKLGRTNVKPKIDIGQGTFARQEKRAGSLIKRLAGLATAYIGVRQAIRLLGSSIRVFTELEDNLLATKAVTQATTEQFGALEKQAKELGRTTVKTAGESARAQTLLARAGFSVNEVLATVPALIDLSTAGQLELADATSITANILRSFDVDVLEVGRVMDVLALASSRANTTIGGIGEGAKFASPIFAALGLRIEEMAAAQAVLADRGLDASLGGTGLRISMQNLIDPTEKARKTLKGMGIELEDVDLKGETLVEVIELLADKNLSAAQAFEIFSARGGTAMLNLTAGVEKFGKLTTELLTEAEGTVKRMADTMQEGLGGSTRRLISAVEAAQIAFAEGFTPSLIDAQQRSVEFLNTNEQNLQSLGRLAGKVLDLTAGLANLFTGTSLTSGLQKDIDRLLFGVDGMSRGVDDLEDRWTAANAAISGGVKTLDARLVGAREELKKTEASVRFYKKRSEDVGAFASQIEHSKQRMVESQAVVLALRQEIDLLQGAHAGVVEAEKKATEISTEHEKAIKREENAAKALSDRVKALAAVERDAERVTKKFTTAKDKLAKELAEVEKLFSLGAISVKTYEHAIESLGTDIKRLALAKLEESIKSLQQQIELFEPDIQVRVVVDDSELEDLLSFVQDEHVVTIDVQGVATIGASSSDALLPTSAEIAQLGKDYKSQLTAAQKLAIVFEEKWDDIADAGILAAELIGGSFGDMLQGLIGGIDQVISGLDRVAEGGLFNKLAGGASAGAGIAQFGQSLGIFKGPQQQTQFGAQGGGDLSSELGAIGAIAGSFIPVIGTILGGVIGSVLGGLIKRGADEGLATLMQIGEEVETTITKNEGGLGDILASMGDSFARIIEDIESSLGAELQIGGGGIGLKIRGDVVRVFVNGLERDFATIEEALEFAVLEALKSATFGEGLGDEVRKVLESGNFGSVEELDIGLAVAKVLDEGASGANQYTKAIAQLTLEHKQISKVVQQFGLDQGKANQVYADRLNLLKQDIDLTMQSALGVQDRLRFAQQQKQAIEALNDALLGSLSTQERELELLKEREQAQIDEVSAAEQALEERRNLSGESKRFDEELAGLVNTLGDANRGLENTREEIAATESALVGIPDSIDVQAIANAFNLAGRQSGQDLGRLLQEIMGQNFLNAEMDKLAGLQTQAQLAAQLASTQLLLASTEILDATVRGVLETLLIEGNKVLQGLVEGSIVVGSVTSGIGRRKQKLAEQKREAEEAARVAEQAAKSLSEFNKELAILELNASTSSGTLGSLAARLIDITSATEALEFGASDADVRRLQSLQLRDERQGLIAPFESTRRTNFIDESGVIERERRDAIERAKLIAQTQAELLGTSFDVVFAAMEDSINKGAVRAQAALTREMVKSLGLPLEKTRASMNVFKSTLLDLQLAYKTGAITEGRYLDLLQQIEDQQAQAVGGSVLALTEKFYKDIEGGEEFRRSLLVANFDLELAQAELRFNTLLAEGALADDMADRIGGLIDFMKDNPPDWDEFFKGGPSDPSGGGFFRSPGGVSGGVGGVSDPDVRQGFENLITSLEDFINSFDKVDVGRFESQAIDWVSSFDRIQGEINDAFSSTAAEQVLPFILAHGGVSDVSQLTAAQIDHLRELTRGGGDFNDTIRDLLDLLELGADIGIKQGAAPQKILDMYKGTLEVTSQLAAEYAAIGREFEDVAISLGMLDGSTAQLAEAEAIRQERILAFWDSALAGVRSVADSIRGGQFGGVASVAIVDRAEDTLDDLVTRLAVDPLDFEALEQLETAQTAFIEAQKEFTGGVGPQFAEALKKVLGISDSFDPSVPPVLPAPAPPEIMLKMDDQTSIMQTQSQAMASMIRLTENRVAQIEQQHQEILSKMDEAIVSNEAAIEDAGAGLTPPG